MVWSNGSLSLYHGTDDLAAASILSSTQRRSHGILLSHCKARTDFGCGFYTTTRRKQAENWANLRYVRGSKKKKGPRPNKAVVLKFEVNRNKLASLHSMSFILEGHHNGDFWNFVRHCRNGIGPHFLNGHFDYDLVYGLVTLWPQSLIVNNADQVSFHTELSLDVLSGPKAYFASPKFI